MTPEEAKIIIGNIPIKPEVLDDCYSITEYQEAKTMAIKALGQQPCEYKPLIIDNPKDEDMLKLLRTFQNQKVLVAEHDCLPSVTPIRPTGKWIEKEDYNLDTYYECSECGADYCIEGDILIHKYCPNCGARMVEMVEMVESEE